MRDPADELDVALESGSSRSFADVQALVDMAGELRAALTAWRPSPAQRAAIDRRLGELLAHDMQPAWRRLLRRPHVPAYIGGAAVTVAAAAAIGMALARGRRHQHAVPA